MFSEHDDTTGTEHFLLSRDVLTQWHHKYLAEIQLKPKEKQNKHQKQTEWFSDVFIAIE